MHYQQPLNSMAGLAVIIVATTIGMLVVIDLLILILIMAVQHVNLSCMWSLYTANLSCTNYHG